MKPIRARWRSSLRPSRRICANCPASPWRSAMALPAVLPRNCAAWSPTPIPRASACANMACARHWGNSPTLCASIWPCCPTPSPMLISNMPAAGAPGQRRDWGSDERHLMEYLVRHRTTYRYLQDVSYSCHLAHLALRGSALQQVISTQLTLDPPPASRARRADFFGNQAEWFTL